MHAGWRQYFKQRLKTSSKYFSVGVEFGLDTVQVSVLLKDKQSVRWIDSGEAIARRVEAVLKTLNSMRPSRKGVDIALLVGPDAEAARAQAFEDFGFPRIVGLCPE